MANRPTHQAPETPSELAVSARNAGLHYVTDRRPGIVRARKRGGAFDYFDPHGRRIRETKSLARIKRLAIPPAWRDVWISPDASGIFRPPGVTPAVASNIAIIRTGERSATKLNTIA